MYYYEFTHGNKVHLSNNWFDASALLCEYKISMLTSCLSVHSYDEKINDDVYTKAIHVYFIIKTYTISRCLFTFITRSVCRRHVKVF